MVATYYTQNIYDMFKKEWKNSFDCEHETVSKEVSLLTLWSIRTKLTN